MSKKNHIIIHQAFYGEVNHSHGWLFSTIDDVELKAFLTGFTDRPSSLPAGINMQSYYSAIMHGKYYLFTLTFPDNIAQRSGMVFTHVLIVNIEDIAYVSNLDNLFSNFCKTIPIDKTSLQKLLIPSSLLEVNEAPSIVPAYVLQGVKEMTTGNLPILICGESTSFVKLITSFWAGLTQSFRTKISYTAGFSTTNIDASKTVIHFQKNLEDSLRNIEFISDKNNELVEVKSTVEKYILTPFSDNQFELFIKDLNVNLNNWIVLQSCAKAYEGYQNYIQLNNDALKQLMRQLAKISPNKNDGRLIKEKLISEIKQRIDSAKENNLKSLKNLPLNAFYSGEDIVAKSLKSFIETELSKNDNFNDELISEVVVLSHKEDQSNWWHTAIRSAFQNAIKDERIIGVQNFWRLLIKSEESLSSTLSFLPEDRKYERLLIGSIPENVPEHIAENFAKSIQKRKWVLLHAHLIQTYLTSKEAVKQQLFLEKDLSLDDFEGSNHIVREVTNKELLSLTIETKEDFFTNEYAARSVKKPTLLNDLDIKNQTWLSIWASSLKETNALEHGILRLSEKIEQILSCIPEGMKVPEEIISLIANSEYADILKLKNRADLWRHLQPDVKVLFLEATANRLVKEISSEGLTAVIIEPELMNYISSDEYVTALLRQYRSDINIVMEVYEYIPHLKDSFLADYVKYYHNNLSDVQSARLGNLVISKRFNLSARQIFEKAKHNSSFKIALNSCEGLVKLGFLDILVYGHLFGKTISREEAYTALLEITIQLYPQGPEDRNIWQRADGDLSKLHQHKSREENWQAAISLLKNGGGGRNISTKTFIKEMMDDYPNNIQLKAIIKCFKQNNV